jgi:hypothetical protein
MKMTPENLDYPDARMPRRVPGMHVPAWLSGKTGPEGDQDQGAVREPGKPSRRGLAPIHERKCSNVLDLECECSNVLNP